MGNLEMALDDSQSGSKRTNYIEKAFRSANRAAELSRQMLTYVGQCPGERFVLKPGETVAKLTDIFWVSLTGKAQL